MPIYEYKCRECEHEFDLLRSIRDDDKDVECPVCHKQDSERKISRSALGEFLKSLTGGCGSSRSGFG